MRFRTHMKNFYSLLVIIFERKKKDFANFRSLALQYQEISTKWCDRSHFHSHCQVSAFASCACLSLLFLVYKNNEEYPHQLSKSG